MRSLIVLLLLALFFLTGLVVGMDRGQMDASQNTEKTQLKDKMGETEQVMVVEQSPNKGVQSTESSMNLTQKVAMFLENVVGGMYEMIVGMIYQIVQVFF